MTVSDEVFVIYASQAIWGTTGFLSFFLYAFVFRLYLNVLKYDETVSNMLTCTSCCLRKYLFTYMHVLINVNYFIYHESQKWYEEMVHRCHMHLYMCVCLIHTHTWNHYICMYVCICGNIWSCKFSVFHFHICALMTYLLWWCFQIIFKI